MMHTTNSLVTIHTIDTDLADNAPIKTLAADVIFVTSEENALSEGVNQNRDLNDVLDVYYKPSKSREWQLPRLRVA